MYPLYCADYIRYAKNPTNWIVSISQLLGLQKENKELEDPFSISPILPSRKFIPFWLEGNQVGLWEVTWLIATL